MIRSIHALCVAAACSGIPAAAPAADASPMRYSVTCVSCAGLTGALAINDRSVMAGSGAAGVAAILSKGHYTLLGTLGGHESTAYALNSHGRVVGGSDLPDGSAHAFAWKKGVLTDLGTLPGGDASRATGIDSRGEIVGMSTAGDSASHGFIYHDGVMTDLGHPADAAGPNVIPQAINDRGHVVGILPWSDASTYGCFLYRSGTWTNLGHLQGDDAACTATAINVHDRVVGFSDVRTPMGHGRAHAFLWADGAMQDLGTLPGGEEGNSAALGVNDAGQVVGYSDAEPGTRYAVIYDHGRLVNLDTVLDKSGQGWTFNQALSINGQGRIVAWGYLNGVQRAALLTPVAR